MKMSPDTPSTGLSGMTKPKPARMRLHAPDDQVHAVGQAEMVAARLNQVAGLDQPLQQALDRGPLLARNLQPLEQLPGRGRMLDLVADGGQELFAVQHSASFYFSQPPCCLTPL